MIKRINSILTQFIIIICFVSSGTASEVIDPKAFNSQLTNDEGLLLLSIKTNVDIKSLTIKSEKKVGKINLKNIPKGSFNTLIKLKAGKYYWNQISFKNKGLKFTKNYSKKDHSFDVEPGVVNYSGEWGLEIEYHTSRYASIKFETENKFTTNIQYLENDQSSQLKKFKIKYQGEYKDGYPEVFSKINHSIDNLKSYDISHGIDREIKKFSNIEKYINTNTSLARLSPNGRFIALKTKKNNLNEIKIIDTTNFKSFSVLKEKLPDTYGLRNLMWIDNDSLYFQALNEEHVFNQISHVELSGNNIKSINTVNIPVKGRLVNRLIGEDNLILMSSYYDSVFAGKGLYKVDTTSEKTIKKSFKKRFTKKAKFNDAIYWLADSIGNLRIVMLPRYNKDTEINEFDLWFYNLSDKKWSILTSYKSYKDIETPLLIKDDSNEIYMLSDEYGDKTTIQSYTIKDYSHIKSVYQNDNFSIEGVITNNESSKIVGVSYFKDGFQKFEYINEKDDNLDELRKKNPNLKLYNVNQNYDSSIILVFGIDEYTGGSWYIYKPKSNEFLKFNIVDQEYDSFPKGDFYHLKIKTEDNINIDGYLVIPNIKSTSKIPLIVNPHGGPIAVRDSAYSNEIQQFFASQGFATLRVNYRGSSGYGKKFENLGKKEWGENIESDINEMVDYVLKNFNISKSNICSMGSSYGGYSSIMLSILFPERYKCAVSHAGVMDIPLMYSTADFRLNENVLDEFKEITGDPHKIYDELLKKSPVYRQSDIKNPILMFHGIDDRRVTIENSYRLNDVLNSRGFNSQLIVLENEKHSIINHESRIIFIARSLEFIEKTFSE